MRIGIIGGSGYTGGELLRLLLSHPNVEIVQVTSRENLGENIFRIHANLRGLTNLKFDKPDLDNTIKICDLVFIATPHGVSSKLTPRLVEAGLKIVDLSADFRLKNPDDYPKWYGWDHPRPELVAKAVYGVPELHRDEIKKAQLVACPGCMAVTTILGLAPVVKAKLISLDCVIADVKIGASGAGVKSSPATQYSERYGVIRPYKPVGHRHTAEIEQELRFLSNMHFNISISAHAVNIVRGILSTIHTFIREKADVVNFWKAYREFYKDEPFIRLVRDRKGLYRFPDPKIILGSNFCDIGFEIDNHTNRLVILSAIDNLMKGAAGIAVQNMNLMIGIDETTALRYPPIHPI